MNWKRTVGQRIRGMSALQAARYIDRITAGQESARQHDRAESNLIVREIAGRASKEIKVYVIRKLEHKAGIIRKENA